MYFTCIIGNDESELILSMKHFVAVELNFDQIFLDFGKTTIFCLFSSEKLAKSAFERYKIALEDDGLTHVFCDSYQVKVNNL